MSIWLVHLRSLNFWTEKNSYFSGENIANGFLGFVDQDCLHCQFVKPKTFEGRRRGGKKESNLFVVAKRCCFWFEEMGNVPLQTPKIPLKHTWSQKTSLHLAVDLQLVSSQNFLRKCMVGGWGRREHTHCLELNIIIFFSETTVRWDSMAILCYHCEDPVKELNKMKK